MKSVGWHSKGRRYGQKHWCASESRTALMTQTFLNVYACGHWGPLVSFHRGFDICSFFSCRPPGEQQSGASAPAVRSLSATVSSTSSVSSGSSGLMRQNSNAAVGKPGPLPANLDEMKVNVLWSCTRPFLPLPAGSAEWCCCPRAGLRWTDRS